MRKKTTLAIMLISLSLMASGQVAKTPPKPELIKFTATTPEQLKESPPGMIYVPAGEFLMGCNGGDDLQCQKIPQHKVFLDAYLIDKYEVTNEEYNKCVQAKICEKPSYEKCECGGDTLHGAYIIKLPLSFQIEKLPVTCINWYQAKQFCEWRGKRLPTNAEWEKAARGTDGRRYPWGNQSASCDYAIMSEKKEDCYDFEESHIEEPDTLGFPEACGMQRPWPVGSKTQGASPYGCMDMAGNVDEWTKDNWDRNYYKNSPYMNPKGPIKGDFRVVRGGNWMQCWYNIRTYYLEGYPPGYRSCVTGFRCASTP